MTPAAYGGVLISLREREIERERERIKCVCVCVYNNPTNIDIIRESITMLHTVVSSFSSHNTHKNISNMMMR